MYIGSVCGCNIGMYIQTMEKIALPMRLYVYIYVLVCAIETPRVIASVGPIGERVQVEDGHSKTGHRQVDNDDA